MGNVDVDVRTVNILVMYHRGDIEYQVHIYVPGLCVSAGGSGSGALIIEHCSWHATLRIRFNHARI